MFLPSLRAELLAGAEGLVDDRAVARPAQLGADERRPLAGVDVLELDHLVDGAVHLDVIPAFQLICADRHCAGRG
jgi:hypothetical protein